MNKRPLRGKSGGDRRSVTGWGRGIRAAVSLSMLLVLAGVVPAAGQEEDGSGGALEGKVIIAQAVDEIVFLPVYVALANDYWRDEGLDVELVQVKGGPIATSALVAGQAQVASNSADTVFLANRAGADVAIFANLLDKGMSEIVVRADVLEQAGITMEQWEGMSFEERAEVFGGLRWAIIGPGGLTDLVVRDVLRTAGYDPDTDTEIVPVGGPPEILGAFQSGQIDAMLMSPPFTRIAVDEGDGVLVGGLHESGPQYADLSFEVLATTKQWAEENPEKMAALGRGIARACDYSVETDPSQIADDLHDSAFFLEIEPDLLAASVEAVQPTVAPGCIITQESIDNMIDFYVFAGSIEESEAPSTEAGGFWTNEYLQD